MRISGSVCIAIVLFASSTSCSSGRSDDVPSRPSPVQAWRCDRNRGEQRVPLIGGQVLLAVSLETGRRSELTRTRSQIRHVAMAGQSVYWTDGEGVHVWSFGTGKVHDVVRTPEAGPVAGNEKAVAYSDGDRLILVDLMSGRSRWLADLKNRFQTYEHIVMTHDAVYWGNVHPLGTMKIPERDSLWRVSLEEGARPTLIATIDTLKGFCVGGKGEVVWLDGGPGPWMRAPEQDGARVARLMLAGATRPLAEVAAKAEGDLAASDSGFVFTTLNRKRGDLVVWNVSFAGAVKELPARLPASSSLLGLWQGTVVAMRDDDREIFRVPLSR